MKASYCGRQCQQEHWKEHKPLCQLYSAKKETKDPKAFVGGETLTFRIGSTAVNCEATIV
jgi:hypothetical protein